MTAHEATWPAPQPPTGVLADRYELGPLLGTGGAADVFRGVDLRLERPVAVKVFRPQPGVDTDAEVGFSNEALLLAPLQHPGLVTLYDAGRHQNRAYLVMQLIEGPTLRRHMDTAVMPPRRVAELGTRLARALAHVHAAGIVHRDVKPSNILLDTDGLPYLTDFGISRLNDVTTRTSPAGLIGTPAYLAPEQVLGKGPVLASDVYALGLVLLECLKGRLEYEGGPLESAVSRLHRPPEFPGGLPPAFTDLLRAMTAAEPAERPAAQRCADLLASATASTSAATASADDSPQAPTASPGAGSVPHHHREAGLCEDTPRSPAGAAAGQARTTRRPPATARRAARPVLISAIAAALVATLGAALWATDLTGSPERGATPATAPERDSARNPGAPASSGPADSRGSGPASPERHSPAPARASGSSLTPETVSTGRPPAPEKDRGSPPKDREQAGETKKEAGSGKGTGKPH